MKTDEEIRRELEKVEADERINYPAAAVQINAPLALIQLSLTTKANTLRWALGIPTRQYYGKD